MEEKNLFKSYLERKEKLEKEIGLLHEQYKELKHIFNSQYLTRLNTSKDYVNYHNTRTLYKNALKEYKELELFLNSVSTFDINDAKYIILYYFDLYFKENYIITNSSSKKKGIKLNRLLICEENDIENLEKPYILLPSKGKVNLFYLYNIQKNSVVKQILYTAINDLIIEDSLDKNNDFELFLKRK